MKTFLLTVASSVVGPLVASKHASNSEGVIKVFVLVGQDMLHADWLGAGLEWCPNFLQLKINLTCLIPVCSL